MKAVLFIQLANFHRHYLVFVITDVNVRFALISVQVLVDNPQGNMIMDDIGWLDVQRIHGDDVLVRDQLSLHGSDGMALGALPANLGGRFDPFDVTLGTDR